MKSIIAFLFFSFLMMPVLVMAKPSDKASEKANFIIEKIISDKEIVLKPINLASSESKTLKPGSILAIYAQNESKVIAFATVIKKSSEQWILCSVTMEEKDYILRENNKARVIQFNESNNLEFEGNYNLIRDDEITAQARYRSMTYLGFWSGQTATALTKKEWLLGPSVMGYGLHERIQLTTTPFLDLISIYNIAAKLVLIPDEHYTFSTQVDYSYYASENESPVDFSLMFDTFNSSKIISYTKLTFYDQRPRTDSYFYAGTQQSKRGYTAELQNYYGVMLSNWNRVLIGPNYNFDERVLGGNISYAFIGAHSTFIIGLITEDFSKAHFGSNGYRAILDFYWRY